MPPLKLSVVISTTGSSHLDAIIRTFLSSYEKSEIILINDNPALKLQAPVDDPRLKIVANETNIGLTRSLNKAICMAGGDIIVRADDDDLPEPERLAEIAAFFEAHPAIDLVYSHAKGVDCGTERSWMIEGPEDHTAICEKLLRRNFIVHSSLAFRRASLERINFYNETFRFAQDYDLYLRCIRSGLTFGCIPKILVTRLYHDTSITVAKRKRQILHSMAARLLHEAQATAEPRPWPVIARYAALLFIPDWARRLRRKIGHGK